MIGEHDDGAELKELLAEQNQSGETALYVAAEFGHTDMVKILMKHSDSVLAGTKAKNGFDAFHIGGAARPSGWSAPVDAAAVREWREALDA